LCRTNGKKATDLIWKPLLRGKFDVYWDKVTMAWLWTRIKVRQTSRKPGEQVERLGYFDGGFNIMVTRWVEELEKRGVKIHTSAFIESFGDKDGKPTIKMGGQEQVFDAVVNTVSSNVFSKLGASHPQMTKEYSDKLNSIDYIGAVVMVMTTKKPITTYYWHQIHDEDAPFLVLLSLDSLVGTEKINGHHVYYIGDYTQNDSELMNKSEDQIRSQWIDGAKKLFPALKDEDIEETYVFKFKNAQHIVDTTYEDRIPAMRTPLKGFYLANFSQIFPEDRGTNYAVREGKKVADLVREDIA
jgi:protoporphyrinogen oxidase